MNAQKNNKKRETRKNLLKTITMSHIKTSKNSYGTRQKEIEGDAFLAAGLYQQYNTLLMPPYAFETLYQYYEQSDVLQACIDAMVKNVHGFGHTFHFIGDDLKEQKSPQAIAEKQMLTDFFEQVNEKQSFKKLRKELGKEFEILGISGIEVIRDLNNNVQMLYHAKMKNIRMTKRSHEGIPVTINIMRNGKIVDIQIFKHFRKFAQLENGKIVKWFKEFGDPRIMDATTGEYTNSEFECKEIASEILIIKNNFGNEPYGVPRWIGALLQVLGRTNAQYINYDLFDSQGIPPLLITVSGGVLNDESLIELENIIKSLKGVRNWNKIALLESEPSSISLEDKGNAKIDIKNMSDYRSEDQMFDRYLNSTKADVRHIYRLPDLYIGASETYTHSTSKSAQKVAEEQIFVPEREDFDELINFLFLQQEFKIKYWKFVTKGPKLSSAEDISKGVETFAKSAAFSINNAIDQANTAFNMQMSKFDADWAKYPYPLVKLLIQLGRLKIDGLENAQLPTQITQSFNESIRKIAKVIGLKEEVPDLDNIDDDLTITPELVEFVNSLHDLINKKTMQDNN